MIAADSRGTASRETLFSSSHPLFRTRFHHTPPCLSRFLVALPREKLPRGYVALRVASLSASAFRFTRNMTLLLLLLLQLERNKSLARVPRSIWTRWESTATYMPLLGIGRYTHASIPRRRPLSSWRTNLCLARAPWNHIFSRLLRCAGI